MSEGFSSNIKNTDDPSQGDSLNILLSLGSREKKAALIQGDGIRLERLACMKGDWSIAVVVRAVRYYIRMRLSSSCHGSSGSP